MTVSHNRRNPGDKLMEHHVERILRRDAIAGAVAANAFGTTVLLVQKSMGHEGGERSNRCPVAANYNDRKVLAGLKLQRVGLQMGTLRMDEFNTPALRDELLSLGEDGLVYPRERLPEKPINPLAPSNESARFRHNERLRCPAVAAQLIPFAVRAVPQVALKAQQRIEQRRT